jgi:hypothetical protein
MKTASLPLAIWVLGAIAAGILTSLLFSLLFRLSNFAATREVHTQMRWAARRRGFRPDATPPQPSPDRPSSRAATSQRGNNSRTEEEDVAWQNWEGYEETVERKPAEEPFGWKRAEQPVDRNVQVDEDEDDWERIFDDDWSEADVETQRSTATATSARNQPSQPEEEDFSDLEDGELSEAHEDPRSRQEYQSRERLEFERPQKPRASSRSGSTYSYSYRDSDNPAVGRAESVIDAEYRVIIPPYRPLDSETEEKDE